MTLREEIKTLSGNRRRFFLLRIADLDTKAALKLCGVVRGTYNTWLQNKEFVELYRRRDEFAGDFKQEAIQLLRRDNQLEAVLLEGKILAKMKSELATGIVGENSIIRSNLAKEVYSKLIGDLDVQKQEAPMSWAERFAQFFNISNVNITPGQPAIEGEAREQIGEGEIVNGEFEAAGK